MRKSGIGNGSGSFIFTEGYIIMEKKGIMYSSVNLQLAIYFYSLVDGRPCAGSLRGRKVEPGTHCLRMLSSPRISGGLETSRYYSVILSVYHRITVRYTRVVGEL